MQSLLSPHGSYSSEDVDGALARVFGPGVRPLQLERALCEAMLSGWRSQQAARYLKPKSISANERAVRAFVDHVGCWPWEWQALPEPAGKTLACWCAPRPCHGDQRSRSWASLRWRTRLSRWLTSSWMARDWRSSTAAGRSGWARAPRAIASASIESDLP